MESSRRVVAEDSVLVFFIRFRFLIFLFFMSYFL